MKEWIKPNKITFKEKIKLLFKPMKYKTDITRNFMTIICYKEMNGKIYIMKESIIEFK